jgi:hypothetical protein
MLAGSQIPKKNILALKLRFSIMASEGTYLLRGKVPPGNDVQIVLAHVPLVVFVTGTLKPN